MMKAPVISLLLVWQPEVLVSAVRTVLLAAHGVGTVLSKHASAWAWGPH